MGKFKPAPRPEYFVSDGISRGQYWFTCYRRQNGSLRRVCSPKLPIRATKEEAERDLAAWREEKGVH